MLQLLPQRHKIKRLAAAALMPVATTERMNCRRLMLPVARRALRLSNGCFIVRNSLFYGYFTVAL